MRVQRVGDVAGAARGKAKAGASAHWPYCERRAIGAHEKQEAERWANHRVENSHLPFQRREGAMSR